MLNRKEMKRIVVLGGGGHSRSIIDSVRSTRAFADIVITDPAIAPGEMILGCKVVGGDDALQSLYDNEYGCAIIGVGTIGNMEPRHRLDKLLTSIGFELVSVYDPSAVVAESSSIKDGTYVAKNACVNSDAKIGRNAIINTCAVIDHDCCIGDYVHVAVGAVVCGGCYIENDTFIGANATIIQGVRIGHNSIIGAGSIVLANVPANTTVIGAWGGGKQGLKPIIHRRCAA